MGMMDLNGFYAISQQISMTGGLDSATMKQLNNPTASPFSAAQSSQLSSVMADIKSGKFEQMAAEDAKKKAEKEDKEAKNEERKDRLLDLLEQLVAQGDNTNSSSDKKKKTNAAVAGAVDMMDFGILDENA